MLQVNLDLLLGLDAERDQPFFAAFAEDPDETCGEVAGGRRQVHQFGDAEPGGVEEKEHRPIAVCQRRTDRGRGKQAVNFAGRQGLGQDLATPRQVDNGKRVAFDVIRLQQKGKEMLQGRDSSGIAAMADAPFPGFLEEAVNDGNVDLSQAGYRRVVEKNQEKIDVRGICLDGVVGESPLGNEVVQKGFGDGGKIFGEL